MFNHPAVIWTCGRCKKELGYDLDNYEVCWFCLHPLCDDCWDFYGHCGHKKADEMNEKARKANESTLNHS